MASSLATCCRERRGCGWPPGSSRSCRCSSWSAASPTWRAGRRWSAAAAATSSTCRAGCRGCCGRCSSSRPSGWYFRRCSATSGCRRSRPGRSAGSWASRCGSSAPTWWSWPWHRLWCGCTGAGGSGFPPRWPRRPGRPHRDGPVPAQHGRAARRPVEHEPADHLHRGAGHLAARPGDARARAGVGLARPTPPLDRRHRRRIDGDDRVPVAPHRNGYGPRARPGRTWPTAHPRRRPVVGHPSHLARPARRRPSHPHPARDRRRARARHRGHSLRPQRRRDAVQLAEAPEQLMRATSKGGRRRRRPGDPGRGHLLNNRLLPQAYVLTCLAAAGLLLVLARRDGCSWSDLGLGTRQVGSGLRWAAVLVGVVLLADAVAVGLPVTRQAFADTRATALSGAAVLWHVLVRIPLGTALLEEVAFRGVLLAMLARRRGVRVAVIGSSLLFGLWHVLPSLGLRNANAAVADLVGPGPAGTVLTVIGAAAGATLAGVALCELRRRSGSLLAPFALHWALNGLGLLFAWAFAG